MRMEALKTKKKQQGFSLVEVMLALLILNVGLLTFTQSQLMALQTSKQAYFINLADLTANALAEQLHICPNQACIQAQLALTEKDIANIFPEAEVRLIKQGNDYKYAIGWSSINYQRKFKHTLELLFRL